MEGEGRSRIRAIQMGNLKCLLGINAWTKEFCRVMKWVDKMIDDCVLQWFVLVGRKKNNRIAKRDYVGDCTGRPLKRWMIP